MMDKMGIKNNQKLKLVLAASEATTNVLKHAVDGTMKIYKDDNLFRIIVEDCGEGIRLSELLKSTLRMGYSSKMSLGQGLGIMIKISDLVAIHTCSKGTTVILEAKLNDNKQIDGKTYKKEHQHVSLLF
jgi:anti-sigma regulatory factor (Ser/Thr protein kinase)